MSGTPPIPGDVRGRWFSRYIYEAQHYGASICAQIDHDDGADVAQTDFFWQVLDYSRGSQTQDYGQATTLESAKTEALESLRSIMEYRAAKQPEPFLTPERSKSMVARTVEMLRTFRP